uniref:Pco130633 n=1 Tax=Arundo donax TaxID=35708 RepID=A0A0A9DQM0_ARUDO
MEKNRGEDKGELTSGALVGVVVVWSDVAGRYSSPLDRERSLCELSRGSCWLHRCPALLPIRLRVHQVRPDGCRKLGQAVSWKNPMCFFFLFSAIRAEYVSAAYRPRIRIGGVSDTRHGTWEPYSCFRAHTY